MAALTAIEDLYEENVFTFSKQDGTKRMRMLLPIKTKEGNLETRLVENDYEEVEEKDEMQNADNSDNEEEQTSDIENIIETESEVPVSAVELLACREKVLRSKKFKIGILSSSLLENPELKSGNFKLLLDLMDEYNPEVCITVKKLATASLLEIFKDLLPSYQILNLKSEGIKLKKETLALHNYEAVLLKSYKNYLQKLEKMANVLRRKRGDSRPLVEAQIHLGEMAVTCMCSLLINNPYFNFSVNVSSFVVPLLDNKHPKVREIVEKSISQVLKEDKRGEISLTIVRKINQYIKTRGHSIHPEVISVLLALRIKDVNLDKEKVEDTKQKKLMSHKQRILSLSKKERKRSKKLKEIEKELLETKAEENKQTKEKVLTEITSIVFTIYFRILKQAPNSKVLSACLEGLAKFAHCINLEFYQDLVKAIDTLMEDHGLGLKEQLHCVQCVFTILSGQGSSLTIDPYRFYAQFYKNMLKVHIGKTHQESDRIINTLEQILIHRRKRITQARLIAFVKRIGTLTLQSHHNTSLGLLCIIKQVMQLGKSANILLDTDSSTGNGFYDPELEDPEYCNAHCTALYELSVLQRHYHNTVQKIAKNIACGVPTSGEGSLHPEISKLTPIELFTEFDPTEVAFKPVIPPPKKVQIKSTLYGKHTYASSKFEEKVMSVNVNEILDSEFTDFYKELKTR
ncbi:nucleolar complex protein 3 isoform X2 [Prorops nasuta]|uniref:nucleolar complex protein 3 isoform X2 n=1 Tax=Prorops nasuta TaxID=863751 RepID=UPI0034CFD58D